MIAQIFVIFQVLLKLFGLWEQFDAWYVAKKVADAEKNKQDRDKALEDLKNAKDESDFDKAQSGVVDHIPKP